MARTYEYPAGTSGTWTSPITGDVTFVVVGAGGAGGEGITLHGGIAGPGGGGGASSKVTLSLTINQQIDWVKGQPVSGGSGEKSYAGYNPLSMPSLADVSAEGGQFGDSGGAGGASGPGIGTYKVSGGAGGAAGPYGEAWKGGGGGGAGSCSRLSGNANYTEAGNAGVAAASGGAAGAGTTWEAGTLGGGGAGQDGAGTAGSSYGGGGSGGGSVTGGAGGAGAAGRIEISYDSASAICAFVLSHSRNLRSSDMWYLRQSTASQEIPLGPFVDSTDGNTQETALSIANTDIKIFKTGATSEASKNSGGATHIATGRYYAVLDATDTDTIGPLRVSVHVTGALAVWLDCVVLDETVYDLMFGTSVLMTANLTQVNSASTGVAEFSRAIKAITIGTVGAASSTTSIITSSITPAAAVADQFKGQVVCFASDTTTANLRGQKSTITASTAGGVLTVNTLTDAPVSGDTFTIQ